MRKGDSARSPQPAPVAEGSPIEETAAAHGVARCRHSRTSRFSAILYRAGQLESTVSAESQGDDSSRQMRKDEKTRSTIVERASGSKGIPSTM